MSTTYLAIDLGASSGRAVLGTLENGTMSMEEIHRFKTPIIEEDNHLFWDISCLSTELSAALTRAIAESPDLRSVSVDSWAVDYVRVDNTGAAQANPYTYRDHRLDGVMESAFGVVSKDEIYRTTGIQFLPFNSLYQVLADKSLPGVGATRCRLCIADYFNAQFLAGTNAPVELGSAVIDETMASTTQLMDVHTREWANDLMQRFDIDDRTWPKIVPAGTVLGRAGDQPSVSVVATCSHDTGAAVAATPASGTRPWAYVSCGTWSLFGAELNAPLVSRKAMELGFTNEAGLDGTIRFLKNLTGFWIMQECTRVWSEEDGEPVNVGDLMEEAELSEYGGQPIDMQDPRFLPRGDMPATLASYFDISGIVHPGSRGEMVRLIVESMANSNRKTLREIEELTGETIETLHLFGGGSRSKLLCQLTADSCGIEVVAGPTEATALGNLLVQARAMGDFPAGDSLRDIAIRSSQLVRYTPRISR